MSSHKLWTSCVFSLCLSVLRVLQEWITCVGSFVLPGGTAQLGGANVTIAGAGAGTDTISCIREGELLFVRLHFPTQSMQSVYTSFITNNLIITNDSSNG